MGGTGVQQQYAGKIPGIVDRKRDRQFVRQYVHRVDKRHVLRDRDGDGDAGLSLPTADELQLLRLEAFP